MVNIDDGQTGETLVITGGTNRKIKMVRELFIVRVKFQNILNPLKMA